MNRRWVQWLPSFLQAKLVERQSLQAIIGNTGWLMADRVLRMAVGLIVAVWLARYLGPTDLGVFRYALALVALLGYLADLGLGGIIVRDLVDEPDQRATTLGTTFVLKLAASLLSIVLAVGIVVGLRPDDTLTQLMVGAISLSLIGRAFDTIDLYFQSEVQSRYTALAKGTAFLSASAVTAVLILQEASLVTFALVEVGHIWLGSLGLLLLYHRQGHTVRKWHFSLRHAWVLISRSWPLILSGFSAIVYLKIDQIMLGEMVDEAAVGIYAAAVQLSEVWYFIPTAIASSAFPALLKSRQRSQAIYEKNLQQLYDVLFMMALALAVPVTFVADWAITFLYGQEFAAAGPILSVHIWASLFIFMRAALSKWLIAEDLLVFSMVTHGFGAVTNVVANIILIPTFGGMGAAIATVISYAAASYGAVFLNRNTWPAARMMTRALLAPFRLSWKTLSSK